MPDLADARVFYYLHGTIATDKINALVGKAILHKLYKPDKPFTLFINSQGGNLKDAVAFVEIIQMLNLKLITVATNFCLSAAFILFLAGECRVCLNYTKFLPHKPRLTHAGDAISLNNARKELKFWEEYVQHSLAKYNLQNSGLVTVDLACQLGAVNKAFKSPNSVVSYLITKYYA